jgi:hypothetical protein
LEDWESGIAVYAAAVATASVAWQVKSELRRRATEVRVRLKRVEDDNGQLSAALMTVVNRSEHPVRIDSVGFVAQDGSGHRFTVGNGRTMPFVSEIEGELPAHDGKSTIITADDLMNLDLDPGKPLIAFVGLSMAEAEDDVFRSNSA